MKTLKINLDAQIVSVNTSHMGRDRMGNFELEVADVDKEISLSLVTGAGNPFAGGPFEDKVRWPEDLLALLNSKNLRVEISVEGDANA